MLQRVADESVLRAFALVFNCAVVFFKIVRRHVSEAVEPQPGQEKHYFLAGSGADEMTAESAVPL